MKRFISAFARNNVFANILLCIFICGGILATMTMLREIIPEVNLDHVIITVVWPGGDPEEIEEGVNRKIEDALDGMAGLGTVVTVSAENVGSTLIEVKSGYDVVTIKDKVDNAVDSITSFPLGAEKPIVEQLELGVHVMMIGLSADDISQRELKEWANQVKKELQSLSEVSRVDILGIDDYEISIEVSETQLKKFGITLDQVAKAVQASSLNIPGGKLRTKGEQIRLRTVGRAYEPEEFSEIIVMALPNGGAVTLGQISEIKDFYQDNTVTSTLNGKPAISLRLMKTNEQDAMVIDAQVRSFIAKMQSQLPEGLDLTIWSTTANILENRINLLLRNGFWGLLVVFVSLWLFLDLRLSFWTGMGIPISLCGAFMIMMFMGLTINMITLFAMIMVLGIVVDDAIVVGESIYVARKNGAPPLRAAIEGTLEVATPVIAAVTTTIVAFTPLLFIGGWMGKLINSMPVVVIAALFVSLIECLFLLPAHLNNLPDQKKSDVRKNIFLRFGNRLHRLTNGGMEWFSAHVYAPFLRLVLSWRYMSMGFVIFFLLLTAGLISSGILKMEFFEPPDGNSISATIEFDDSMTHEQIRDGVVKLEEALYEIAETIPTTHGNSPVRFVYTMVGKSFGLPGEPDKGPNSGSVIVDFIESSERGKQLKQIIPEWEAYFGNIPGAESLVFTRMDGELPGDPISIWLLGNDLDKLHNASDALKNKLESYAGLYQVRHTFRPGKNELNLILKPEARALGLTVADLGRQVNAGYFGQEALRVQRGTDNVRVRVRYPEDERNQISDFEQIRIKTPYGYDVPLRSVADIELAPGYATIKRVNGMRQVDVAAEINTELANAEEIIADLEQEFLPRLMAEFPGVVYSVQGDAKNLDETFGALKIAAPLAILGIYIIIATMFRSYIQPLIILLTVPLGAVGACYGHLFMGYNLTIMSIFGVVALAGVVVNDAIVLIERINENLSEGMSFNEAVVKGGVRRFRAIMLTTISTIGGLSPIMMETEVHTKFLIPMAISLSAGVGFATLLTLVYIPCLLAILNDIRRMLYYIFNGNIPTREEVEPASTRSLDLLELQGEKY